MTSPGPLRARVLGTGRAAGSFAAALDQVGVTVTVGDGLASSAFTKADASISVMESGMTTDLSVTLPRALGPMAVTS